MKTGASEKGWGRIASLSGSPLLVLLIVANSFAWNLGYFEGFPLLGGVFLAGFGALIMNGVAKRRNWRWGKRIISWPLLLALQLWLAVEFLLYADNRLIFSDDHPSFLYRLILLRDHFPRIPFFNTAWNAGYLVSELPAVGVLGVFYLTWPVISFYKSFDTAEGSFVYTYLLAYLFIFIVPWACYSAARIVRFDCVTSFVCGFLALFSSLDFLQWALNYGTIGFCLSAGTFPLLLALLYRLCLDDELPPRWIAPAAAITSAVTLSWPLTGLLLLPAAALFILSMRYYSLPRLKRILVFATLFVVFCGPGIYLLLFTSKALSITSSTSATSWTSSEIESVWEFVRHLWKKFFPPFVRVNPLIAAMLLAGLFSGLTKQAFRLWTATLVWIAVLAGFGDLVKPQLELQRFLVHFMFVAALPAARGLIVCWKTLFESKAAERSWRQAVRAVLMAACAGAVILSPLPVRGAYLNQRPVERRYAFAPVNLAAFASAIREHGGEGRTFFTGFMLHDFGARAFDTQDGGHIAPLAAFTRKQLFANYFYHQSWEMVDPVPRNIRDGTKKDIENFFDLLNVSAVVTFDRDWRRYCSGRPRIYKEVYTDGRFRVFTRRSSRSGWFIRGQGQVMASGDGLRLVPESDEVVLKYRYLPQLKLDPGMGEIFPVHAYDADAPAGKTEPVYFIGVRPSPSVLANKSELFIQSR